MTSLYRFIEIYIHKKIFNIFNWNNILMKISISGLFSSHDLGYDSIKISMTTIRFTYDEKFFFFNLM